jgi:hypothetical protein
MYDILFSDFFAKNSKMERKWNGKETNKKQGRNKGGTGKEHTLLYNISKWKIM